MNEKIRVNNKKSNVGVGLVSTHAITLISLVITIVVLIILASVGIYLSLENDGIYTRANEAKEATNKQTATEIINLKITTAQMNKYAEEQRMPTLKELSVVLGVDNDIQYVTEKSQIASTKYEVGENPSSIYTKLNQYPYEFEINSSLQLASINGVKIASTSDQNIKYNFIGDYIEGTSWVKVATLDELQNYNLFILSVYYSKEHKAKCNSTIYTLEELKNCEPKYNGLTAYGEKIAYIHYNDEEKAIYVLCRGGAVCSLMGIK